MFRKTIIIIIIPYGTLLIHKKNIEIYVLDRYGGFSNE